MKGGPGGSVVSGADVSGHAILFPDLKDLSLVTLSTKTPGDFFSKHQLVLHVAKSEMDKVRVFQDNGESALLSSQCRLPAPPMGLSLFTPSSGKNPRAPTTCQLLGIEEAAGSKLEGLSEKMGADKTQAAR